MSCHLTTPEIILFWAVAGICFIAWLLGSFCNQYGSKEIETILPEPEVKVENENEEQGCLDSEKSKPKTKRTSLKVTCNLVDGEPVVEVADKTGSYTVCDIWHNDRTMTILCADDMQTGDKAFVFYKGEHILTPKTKKPITRKVYKVRKVAEVPAKTAGYTARK